MKKHIFYIILLSVIFACGWSPVKDIAVYKNLKKDVTAQFQTLFNREVEIEEVSGILINQIELKNVKFAKGKKLKDGTILTAKKIYLNYNPFKLVASKGDMIPALSKIIIVEPEFTVERSVDDTWNMAQMIPGSSGGAGQGPVFNGKIDIKNGHGWYKDNLGFVENLRGKAFVTEFKNLNGEVEISKNNLKLSAGALSMIDGSNAFANIDGRVNTSSGKYNFVASIKNLDIAKWGSYVMKVPNIIPLSGLADMKLTMTNPTPADKNSPLHFKGDFNLKNGKAMIFDMEAKDIYGYINIHGENVVFKNLNGRIHDTMVTLNGKLTDFTVANYDLTLQADEFDIIKLDDFYNIKTDKYNVSGKGKIKILIGGNYLDPKFGGSFSLDKAYFLDNELSGAGSFSIDGPIISVKLPGLKAFNGRIFGEGMIDMTTSSPVFTFNITTEALDLRSLTGLGTGITGKAGLSSKLTGTLNGARLEGNADLEKCAVLGQHLDKATFNIRLSEKDAIVEDLTLSSKSTNISATGTIENYSDLDLGLKCSNITLSEGLIKAKINKFTGAVYGSLTKKTSGDPLGDIGIKGDVLASDIYLGEQYFNGGNGSIKLEKQRISFDDFSLQMKLSFLTVNGAVGPGSPVDLNIAGKDIDLADIYYLKDALPKEFKPYSGKTDIDISVSGNITKEITAKNLDSLLGLNFAGTILLNKCVFASEKIDKGNINFSWSDNKLAFEDSQLITPLSNINFYGTVDPGKAIDIRVKGNLELSDIKPLSYKYGQLLGNAAIDLKLSGNINSPNISAIFTGDKIKYNNLTVDKISGNIFYNGELLNFLEPLKINQEKDEYAISGKVLLKQDQENASTNKNIPYLSLTCEIIKGDLGTLLNFLDAINSEIATKQLPIPGKVPSGPSATQKLTNIIFPSLSQKKEVVLYSSDQIDSGRQTAIQLFDTFKNELEAYKKASIGKRKINASGDIQGYVKFAGNIDDLNGILSLKTGLGSFESYGFDGIELIAKLAEGTFEVETASLKKEDGIIKMKGSFNPGSTISLQIDAIKMPLDFLALFMGSEKTFKGRFSMHTEVFGRSQKPNIKTTIKSFDADIMNIEFKDVSADLTYEDDVLLIENVSLLDKNNKETHVSGRIPFSSKRPINLTVSVEGESIGLFTFISPDITWLGGSASGNVDIAGTVNKPYFNGHLSISNASLSIKPLLPSYFKKINSEVVAKNNNVQIISFTAKWIDKNDAKIDNQINLSGHMNIDGLFGINSFVDCNFKEKDDKFTVNIPNLYKGDISFNDLSLIGPYYLNRDKAGPTLSGNFEMENCDITLPQLSGENLLPPVILDTGFKIGKNSYIIAGDAQNLISTNFSNLLLNLEVGSENLRMTGTLNEPNIKGDVIIKRGTVNILNREFSLMSEDRQKELFSAEMDKVKENRAVFYGQGGKEGFLPFLTLTAEIKIKAVEKTADTKTTPEQQYTTQDVTIVSQIEGVPFAKEKERGLNISFSSFTEDPQKHEIMPAKYSEQEIKVLLLPEFIKKPLRIAEGESVDANEVVVDYLDSRLNAMLLRGVERDVARSLDLENLTLEYNFGKDLRNLMPAQSEDQVQQQLNQEETVYGVGAEKAFFDKFYINMKYSQAMQESAGISRSLFNYQITYKLNPTLSVLYYREPLSFIEEENNYYKVTLKAGYSF